VIDVKETGLDGGRLAIPPVIARSVSDVAISVFFRCHSEGAERVLNEVKEESQGGMMC